MVSLNAKQTLQFDPKIMEELVKCLNESNIADAIKKQGLLEEGNVGFELMVTPKNSLSIDNSKPLSTRRGCAQLCNPCPGNPSTACWVPYDCLNPPHS